MAEYKYYICFDFLIFSNTLQQCNIKKRDTLYAMQLNLYETSLSILHQPHLVIYLVRL